MKKYGSFRRAAAFALTLLLCAAAALPCAAAYEMPISPANEEESVYLYNMDTGKVILSYNGDTPRYVASTTKMMTALLLLESGRDLNTEVTISEGLTQEFKDIQAYNGADMKLKIGETVRLVDLLYGLLLPSANDAASVIAYELSGGSIVDFVTRMNARALELGCTNTNFTCPHGLYDAGNVSTAEDLSRIAKACYAIPMFMTVAETPEYVLPATNLHSEERTIVSTNLMMKPEDPSYRGYIRGMKTGFTTLAGRCFVTTATQNGHTYGLALLGAPKDAAVIYSECGQLLDWVFASFSERPLVDTETALTNVALTDCKEVESIPLYAQTAVSGYGHASDAVTMTFDVPQSVKATLQSGTVIGTVTVYLDGDAVETVNLVTHETYESDLLTGSKNTMKLLPCLAIALIALALITIVSGRSYAAIAKKNRAKKA